MIDNDKLDGGKVYSSCLWQLLSGLEFLDDDREYPEEYDRIDTNNPSDYDIVVEYEILSWIYDLEDECLEVFTRSLYYFINKYHRGSEDDRKKVESLLNDITEEIYYFDLPEPRVILFERIYYKITGEEFVASQFVPCEESGECYEYSYKKGYQTTCPRPQPPTLIDKIEGIMTDYLGMYILLPIIMAIVFVLLSLLVSC